MIKLPAIKIVVQFQNYRIIDIMIIVLFVFLIHNVIDLFHITKKNVYMIVQKNQNIMTIEMESVQKDA